MGATPWRLPAYVTLLVGAVVGLLIISFPSAGGAVPLSTVDVTFTTSPPNLTIVVDNVTIRSPQTYSWANGSDHTISVDTPQSLETARYVFSNWSDGGLLQHTLHVDNATTLVAGFSTEFPVNISISPAGLELTVDNATYSTPVEFWWAAGSSHDIFPIEIQIAPPGVRNSAFSWLDGSSARRRVAVDGPLRLQGAYEGTEYFLTLSAPPSAGAGCSLSDCWYPSRDSGLFHVTPPAENGSATREHYLGWRLLPALGPLSPATNGSVFMDGPRTIAFEWVTQHALTINSPFGGASGDGWYADGAEADVALAMATETQGDQRQLFVAWSGAVNSTAANLSVRMDGPKVLSAAWRTQYLVAVDASPASATGAGWYDPGEVAVVTLQSQPTNTSDTRWTFRGWTGAVNSPNASVEVPIASGLGVRAVWLREYLLSVVSDHGKPLGGGWYPEGSLAAVSIPEMDVVDQVGHFVFAGWEGAAGGASANASIMMDGPKTAFARWSAAPGGPFTLLPAVAALAGVLAGAIVVLSTPRGQVALGATAIPLFTRLRSDDVRNQFTRGRLLQFIEDNPGANYAHVRRRLALSNGACAYHLRVLERNGDIRRVVSGMSVRFYGATYTFDEEALPPLSFVQRRVLQELVDAGSANFGELSRMLEAHGEAVTDTNLGYHLNVLAREKELISTRREGRKTIYFLEGERRERLRTRLREEYGVDEAMDAAALPPGGGAPGPPAGAGAQRDP